MNQYFYIEKAHVSHFSAHLATKMAILWAISQPLFSDFKSLRQFSPRAVFFWGGVYPQPSYKKWRRPHTLPKIHDYILCLMHSAPKSGSTLLSAKREATRKIVLEQNFSLSVNLPWPSVSPLPDQVWSNL